MADETTKKTKTAQNTHNAHNMDNVQSVEDVQEEITAEQFFEMREQLKKEDKKLAEFYIKPEADADGIRDIELRIDTDAVNCPELTPGNPKFRADMFNKLMQEEEKTLNKQLEELRITVAQYAAVAFKSEEFKIAFADITKNFTGIVSDIGSSLLGVSQGLTDGISKLLDADEIKAYLAFQKELEPYLDAEIEKAKEKGYTLEQIENDEDLYSRIYAAAYKAANKKNVLRPVIKPEHYKILNSKIANKYITLQDILTKVDNNGQLSWLPIDAEENQHEIVIRNALVKPKLNPVIDIVSLTYTGDLMGKASKINSYDISVMNAICSLLLAGNKVFFVEDICKTLSQKPKATDAQIKKTLQSLEKLSDHKIKIDVTEEIKAKLLTIDDERVTDGIWGGRLLDFRTCDMTTEKGTVKTAVALLTEPLLLSYSQGKGQILSIPASLLEMKCRADEETISIRDYLIKEINQLKKGYRDRPIINYDKLLNYIGFIPGKSGRTEKARITSEILTILDGFIEKDFIKSYDVKNGQRNKVTGFEIIV